MRWRSISNLTTIALIISLQACNTHHKLGATTPDRVIDRYLSALATKDEPSMAQLLPPKHQATQQLGAKIAQLGGHQLQQRRVTYTKVKPTLWVAKIEGSYLDRDGMRQQFRDTISTIYEGNESWKLYSGRWYLLLDK